MNETLREKEEAIRIESESLRKAHDELGGLRKRVDQHNELMTEKDRTVQVSFELALTLAHNLTTRCAIDPQR